MMSHFSYIGAFFIRSKLSNVPIQQQKIASYKIKSNLDLKS